MGNTESNIYGIEVPSLASLALRELTKGYHPKNIGAWRRLMDRIPFERCMYCQNSYPVGYQGTHFGCRSSSNFAPRPVEYQDAFTKKLRDTVTYEQGVIWEIMVGLHPKSKPCVGGRRRAQRTPKKRYAKPWYCLGLTFMASDSQIRLSLSRNDPPLLADTFMASDRAIRRVLLIRSVPNKYADILQIFDPATLIHPPRFVYESRLTKPAVTQPPIVFPVMRLVPQ